MADVVQYRLERMVDGLEDLEKKGIFNRIELAELVKKRRDFEYKLKRPSPLKQDFLDYIEFEKMFDSLRRIRRKSVSNELENQGKKRLKKSVSDGAGVLRIAEIYRLATTRFKGDLELWFQYLNFCKENDHRRLKKVLAQAIRFHPKVPGLWIYAAAWEFDVNSNVAAARALMQNGLRMCSNSEDIWVEYLRMELTYLNKLQARKSLLGEDTGTLVRDHGDADEKQWRDENQDLFMSINEVRENDNANASDIQDGESEKADIFRGKGSSVLQTVYNEAIKALPLSMALRKRFLEILGDLDLENSDNLREEILDSMKRDFAKEPEFWDWLARLQVNDLKRIDRKNKEEFFAQLNKAVAIYEEALTAVPSAKLFSLYTKFWMDAVGPEGEDSSVSGYVNISDYATEFTTHLLKVYEKAESMGCLAEDLACECISFYLQLGRLEEARDLTEKLCRGKLCGSVKLWNLRLSITDKCQADLPSTFKIFQDFLTKVSISEANSLWLKVFQFFSDDKKHFNKLVKTFKNGLVRDIEGGSSVSSAVINWVLDKYDIPKAREIYNGFLALPHPSRELYKICIELESNLAFSGNNESLVTVRKLFRSALDAYDQDLDLWRDYLSFEKKVGTSETYNAALWLAGKTLGNVTELISTLEL